MAELRKSKKKPVRATKISTPDKTQLKNLKPKQVKKEVSKKPLLKKLFKNTIRKKRIIVDHTKSVMAHKNRIVKKSINNPILFPMVKSVWESRAVINPAVLYHKGEVHLLYRAMGDTDISVVGHIKSAAPDDFSESDRDIAFDYFATKKRNKRDKKTQRAIYSSGGGSEGGIEDPRVVRIEDKIYMIYHAFDGWNFLRLAMTYISVTDFENRDWNWSDSVLISPPGQWHKNWVMFPEKINGKFAILHNMNVSLMIDYFDSLDYFDGDNFLYSAHDRNPIWETRNKLIRGAGPPPIKTDKGWLVIYHGHDTGQMEKYKMFAMLLDLNDPKKIIAKTQRPILEPEESYEIGGIKANVIYCCGTALIDGILHIYYGSADTYTCLATTNLNEMVEHILNNSAVIIEKRVIIKTRNKKKYVYS